MKLSNIRCTCPAIISAVACCAALYGTCTICVAVMSLNNSMPRCSVVPLPLEPYDSLPGLLFA